MKKLTDYITESEQWMESPSEGDRFGIELEDDTLLETYVMEVSDDGSILLDSTEEIYSLLESWDMLSDDIDTDEHAMEERDAVDEIAPVAAVAGGALARHAGAGALGQMAGRVAGSAVGSAIDRRLSQEPVNEFDVVSEPKADPGEYDQEGDMAKNDLQTMIRAARRLTGMLDDDDNMPEWTQKKITKATDYVDTAADYIASQKERGIMEQPEDNNPVARAVLHRIMMSHPGLLARHGPERVMDAVDELAYHVNIGPDDEIGTSDVSGWVREVITMLASADLEPIDDVDELDEQGVSENADLDAQAMDIATKLTTGKNLEKLRGMAHDSTVYRALDRYFAKHNIPETIYNRVANIVFKEINQQGVSEAEYQGRKVTLNKPMANTDGKSKSKVYVKDPKTGNVKKVTFGDPDMRIRKSNPDARKSFRARHKCDTAKDKTTARYWSCKKW